MMYRNYFMCFALGMAVAVSLLKHDYFLHNIIVLFIAPFIVVIIYMLWHSLKNE